MSITSETRKASLIKTGKSINHRQQQILAILGSREMTAYEILAETGEHDPNYVRPRLTELKESGMVETVGKRKCGKTGRTVAVWKKVQEDNQSE